MRCGVLRSTADDVEAVRRRRYSTPSASTPADPSMIAWASAGCLRQHVIGIEARRFDLGSIEGGAHCALRGRRGEALARHQRGAQQLPASRDHAEELEQRHGARRDAARSPCRSRETTYRTADSSASMAARTRAPPRRGSAPSRAPPELAHVLDEGLRGAAAVARDLAPDEVVRLDARGPFIDRRDARIPIQLCDPRLLDEPHAAVNLDRKRGEGHGILGAPPLDDGDHQIRERLVPGALLCVRMHASRIERHRRYAREGAHRFGLRFDQHEHAADVRMPRDRHASLLAGLRALDALVRERKGGLERPLRQPDALEPHGEARRVHHDEHVFEAAILLADELAHGAAVLSVGEHAGGARVNTELVLDRQAAHVVALAERAVGFTRNFGTTNSDMPFTPSGAPGCARAPCG
jgi:hypothetical protein